MRKIICSIIFAVFYLGCAVLPLYAGLKEGDSLFKQYKLAEAAASYEEALKTDPQDYEVLWRLARTYSEWAFLDKKASVKKRRLRDAEKYAREAVDADAGGFEGHLYLAEILGRLTDFVSPDAKVRFSRQIKIEAEKAIELNPAHFKAYMILGIWHRKVTEANWIEKQLAAMLFGGLPKASLKEAETNLKRSIGINHAYPKSHFELALVYKAQKNNEGFIEELKKTIECPASVKKDEDVKQEAASLLR